MATQTQIKILSVETFPRAAVRAEINGARHVVYRELGDAVLRLCEAAGESFVADAGRVPMGLRDALSQAEAASR